MGTRIRVLGRTALLGVKVRIGNYEWYFGRSKVRVSDSESALGVVT